MAVMVFGVELKVDQKGSYIDFEATKMLFVNVDGNFSSFSGTISVEGDTITSIDGVVDVLSIDTADAKRDDHLLSSDFFDAVKYDKIRFDSAKITDDSVVADITIKDITKPVTFKLEQLYVSEKSVKIKLSAVVDRTEFDIDNNFMSMMIDDDITVTSLLIAK